MMVKEIVFPQDTAHRKSWFKAASFSHPAKMNLGLQIYLIEHYTKAGDWILDPMAGSGSILVATAIGRNVICVELEEKFCVMMRQNWEKIKAQGPMLGYPMGTATILCGDSRNLDGLLADSCIFSPPYADRTCKGESGTAKSHKIGEFDYGKSEGQIGNLPYGSISTILTSPPYGLGEGLGHSEKTVSKLRKEKYRSCTYTDKVCRVVISSPPYEAQLQGSGADAARKRIKEGKYKGLRPDVWISKTNIAGSTFGDGYSKAKDNIGNLKGESYLSAMKIVYENCFSILRDGGLLILVVKNFVRKGQVIRLDSDTIRLCENAGFLLKERLKRRLTQMSFWRTLEKKRWEKQGKQYPEDMSFEHILVFEKK